jgi:hypothetical protein
LRPMNGHPVHPPGGVIWKSEDGKLSRSSAALGRKLS